LTEADASAIRARLARVRNPKSRIPNPKPQ
jgi:hypothetical protein